MTTLLLEDQNLMIKKNHVTFKDFSETVDLVKYIENNVAYQKEHILTKLRMKFKNK